MLTNWLARQSLKSSTLRASGGIAGKRGYKAMHSLLVAPSGYPRVSMLLHEAR
jgi:hypothetical protein